MARILLIDDDAQIRRVFRHMLELEGHEVTDACNGRQGVQCYQEMLPDLVILDILMPEQEGLETIRELRRATSGVKIIAISGRVGPPDFLYIAEKLGAQRVLHKPIHPDELIAAVCELTQG
jgi:CheY-like chemotaxis protein